MIYVSREVATKESVPSGQPRLSRSDIWKGLVMKAENALPFVPGMAKCDIVKRMPNGLIRDIIFRGEDARERVTLYPEKKVVFVRESGNVDGFIVNEILGDDDDLRLRFSFALQLVDAASDSREECEFREIMERDYLKAVDATLGAIRKMVADPQYAN
jgi:Acetylaranotin biosynthesis cluster protein L